MQRIEVGSRGYLAGGVALESHAGIGGRHTRTIVDDLYQRTAGIFHNNSNLGGTCIDSIFHQLLNDRSRSLNSLAGGYLVGHRVGQ